MTANTLPPSPAPPRRANQTAAGACGAGWRERFLREAAEASREAAASGSIRRVEADLPGVVFTPACLAAAPWHPRFFWRSRETGARAAAAGALASGPLSALAEQTGRASPGVRFFGGACFDPEPSPFDDWEFFPSQLWFIPRAEIIESGGRARLALNTAGPSGDAEAAAGWAAGLGGWTESAALPAALSRWDTPNFDGWRRSVGSALGLIAEGGLRKVVLARRSRFQLDSAPEPFAFAAALAALSPRCFHFCIQPGPDSGAFLGATPELLFRRRGRILESEAVAGTRPRSLDAAEDGRLQAQLMAERKERDEHRIVVEAIEQSLAGLAESVTRDPEPRLLKLARIQHLRTAFSAGLKESVCDAAVLRALHPTPATCGLPDDAALAFLRRTEPFDRGWYAGPVGAAGAEDAEFAVAIRSMRLTGSTLDLFAGAGIVQGSDPEAEWAELESKIGGALRLLSA